MHILIEQILDAFTVALEQQVRAQVYLLALWLPFLFHLALEPDGWPRIPRSYVAVELENTSACHGDEWSYGVQGVCVNQASQDPAAWLYVLKCFRLRPSFLANAGLCPGERDVSRMKL